MTEIEETDIAIVGAGPTGLLLAGELAAAGVRAVVLEREPERARMPKANGVVGRAAVELAQRGLLRGTDLRVVRPPRFGFGPLTLRLGLVRGPLHILPVPQRRLEELLEERATRLGATILRGREVTALDQDRSGVTVHAGGELRARYAVGCDGARSAVRKGAGIGFPGLTSASISRIARITLPAGVATRSGDSLELEGIGRFTLFRPNRTAGGSVTFAPAAALDRSAPADLYIVSTHEPRGAAEPEDELDIAELRASLARVLGAELPFTEAFAVRSVVANSRQAERYRSGRILLAGDAAHIFSAGGSSLNVGLLDAIALAGRLAAVVKGAPEAELDAYERERHAAGRAAIEQTRVQAALTDGDERGEAMRVVLGPLLERPGASRRLAALLEG